DEGAKQSGGNTAQHFYSSPPGLTRGSMLKQPYGNRACCGYELPTATTLSQQVAPPDGCPDQVRARRKIEPVPKRTTISTLLPRACISSCTNLSPCLSPHLFLSSRAHDELRCTRALSEGGPGSPGVAPMKVKPEGLLHHRGGA